MVSILFLDYFAISLKATFFHPFRERVNNTIDSVTMIIPCTTETVNMGWNTGFSPVTDLDKGFSLLTMLKLNVCWGVCSSVGLDTDILIGTSVLKCQTLKLLFSPNSSNQMIFSRKLLGMAQTIPQNAHWVIFFYQKLRYIILKMVKNYQKFVKKRFFITKI